MNKELDGIGVVLLRLLNWSAQPGRKCVLIRDEDVLARERIQNVGAVCVVLEGFARGSLDADIDVIVRAGLRRGFNCRVLGVKSLSGEENC